MKNSEGRIMVIEAAKAKDVYCDDRLATFWGKPLDTRDIIICRSLRWAVTGTTENAGWRLDESVRRFEGPIYVDQKVRLINWDAEIQSLLVRCQLVCLDPILGDLKGDIELRTVLTLVHYVLRGWSSSSDCAGRLTFVGRGENADDIGQYDGIVEAVDAQIRGSTFVTIGVDAMLYRQATPKSLFSGLSSVRAKELSLVRLCRGLERRGLMQRKGNDDGYEWHPTAKGIRHGLGANDTGVMELLVRLGLVRELIYAPAKPYMKSEASYFTAVGP